MTVSGVLATIALSFTIPTLALAQKAAPPKPTLDFSVGKSVGLPDDTNPQQRIVNLIIKVINIMLSLSAILALAAMVWGSLLMITSGGNEDRVKKGKEAIKWAALGLIAVGFSFLIIFFIGQSLGAVNGQQGGQAPAGQQGAGGR